MTHKTQKAMQTTRTRCCIKYLKPNMNCMQMICIINKCTCVCSVAKCVMHNHVFVLVGFVYIISMQLQVRAGRSRACDAHVNNT